MKNFKRTLLTASALCALLVVSGCADINSDGTHNTKSFDGTVKQFETVQGVECVFAKRGYGGGLSCNWQKFNSQ